MGSLPFRVVPLHHGLVSGLFFTLILFPVASISAKWSGGPENSPLDFPALAFEAFVERLGDGRLHEVDVADDLRREGVSQVRVEPPATHVFFATTSSEVSPKCHQHVPEQFGPNRKGNERQYENQHKNAWHEIKRKRKRERERRKRREKRRMYARRSTSLSLRRAFNIASNRIEQNGSEQRSEQRSE